MIKKKNKFNLRLFLSTRRYLALAIALALAGTAIIFFATYPQIGTLTSSIKKLETEKIKVGKLKRKSIELEQIKTLPEFAKAEAVNEVLPSHKPVLELLTSLNEAATNSQIIVSDFVLSPGEIATNSTKAKTNTKKSKNKYGILKLDLTVTGPLENVEKFMSLVERISPITSIVDITLTRQISTNNGEEVITAKANLSLNTYFFTQSINATIEAPLPQIGAREQKIFLTIEEFTPSNLAKQTEIRGGGQTDFFGIDKLELD